MDFQVLGKCDCPTGPVVQSKAFEGAEYFHVETPQGIRCCPQLKGKEISMGPIVDWSESEKAEMESRSESIKAVRAQKRERYEKRKILVDKRKKGEDLTLEDLNNLVDLLLGAPLGKQ